MKNHFISILLVFLLTMFSCTTKQEPRSSARFYFGIKIEKKLEPLLYEEQWSWTGEGYVYIIYQFDSVSNKTFLKKNNLSNFNDLPILEKPPLFASPDFNNYIPSEIYYQFYVSDCHDFLNHTGKYKITCNKGELSSSIILYDEDLMKLFMFYGIDNNRNP